MTSKEWLNRGYKIDCEINALLTEQSRLLSRAALPAASAAERVQTTPENVTEARFVSYADYTREIDRRIDELYEIKQEIHKTINAVQDGILRTLLIERYVNFKTWERVAEAMGYSNVKWVRTRLHSKALKEIDNLRFSPS